MEAPKETWVEPKVPKEIWLDQNLKTHIEMPIEYWAERYIRADLVDGLVEALEHYCDVLEKINMTAYRGRAALKALEDGMSDKELLELAAKAAGLEANGVYGWKYARNDCIWNPLTDDGDALRLAVKLDINLFSGYKKMIAEVDSDGDSPAIHSAEEKGDDPYAATRRAIVRAAAAIGQEMQ